MGSQLNKCEVFSLLHQQEQAFVIPNPWDLGSAKLLQGLGHKALATTSAGLAFTLGRLDGNVTLEETLTHCTELAEHTNIPINVDFENGYSDDPEVVAKNVLALVETGVAGCSIEDFCSDTGAIYSFDLAIERVQAATEAIASLEMPFQLTARAENLFHGLDDLEDTIKRLIAFESVGANVLYAPGINSLKQLTEVTNELQSPFNVLAPFIGGASVKEFSDAGAKRISVGGALCFAAVNPILKAGNEMLLEGTFDWMNEIAPRNAVNDLLSS